MGDPTAVLGVSKRLRFPRTPCVGITNGHPLTSGLSAYPSTTPSRALGRTAHESSPGGPHGALHRPAGQEPFPAFPLRTASPPSSPSAHRENGREGGRGGGEGGRKAAKGHQGRDTRGNAPPISRGGT